MGYVPARAPQSFPIPPQAIDRVPGAQVPVKRTAKALRVVLFIGCVTALFFGRFEALLVVWLMCGIAAVFERPRPRRSVQVPILADPPPCGDWRGLDPCDTCRSGGTYARHHRVNGEFCVTLVPKCSSLPVMFKSRGYQPYGSVDRAEALPVCKGDYWKPETDKSREFDFDNAPPKLMSWRELDPAVCCADHPYCWHSSS